MSSLKSEDKPLPLCMMCHVCIGEPKVLPDAWMKEGYTTSKTCKCCATCRIRFSVTESNWSGSCLNSKNGLTIMICNSGEQYDLRKRSYALLREAKGKCTECDQMTHILSRSFGREP